MERGKSWGEGLEEKTKEDLNPHLSVMGKVRSLVKKRLISHLLRSRPSWDIVNAQMYKLHGHTQTLNASRHAVKMRRGLRVLVTIYKSNSYLSSVFSYEENVFISNITL